MRKHEQNYLLHLDSNLLRAVLIYLEMVDIGRLDTAICDSSLRSEFLCSLRIREFTHLPLIKAVSSQCCFLSWALQRQLRFREVLLNSAREVGVFMQYAGRNDAHKSCLSRLETARISNVRMDIECLQVFTQGLNYIPGLQRLHISDNGIGENEAASLAEGFVHIPGLHGLCIGGNDIGESGAASLAKGFVHVHIIV